MSASPASPPLVMPAGHALPGAGAALAAETVAHLLHAGTRRAFDLRIVEETGSTNSDLLRDAAALPSGSVLAAERQSAGRGRRGRAWVAPPGGSLAFSLLWKFDRDAAGLSGLSLAIGVAVARALERCAAAGSAACTSVGGGALQVQLKWPNDLLVRPDPASNATAKLGGILIELAATEGGRTPAVIGIGINLNLGPAADGIDQAVSDLAAQGVPVSPNTLLALLLEELLPVLRLFEAHGFAPLAGEWNRRHVWQGRRVVLSSEPGAAREGVARGVDTDGALLFETSAGVERIVSGEVSLRAA